MWVGGLTGVHADTVVRQLELEKQYIAQAGVTPDAGRASNDNLLDIIDIVQGDTNLANMANQNGVSGFTPFGAFDIVTESITQSEEWRTKNPGLQPLPVTPFTPAVHLDRAEFLDVLQRLDAWPR